jgi:hypothetical protein
VPGKTYLPEGEARLSTPRINCGSFLEDPCKVADVKAIESPFCDRKWKKCKMGGLKNTTGLLLSTITAY